MGRLKTINETMFLNKNAELYEIINGHSLDATDNCITYTDYWKLGEFIRDMYDEENVYDLDSYVDFRICLTNVLNRHGLEYLHFDKALDFAKAGKEELEHFEELYNKLDNPNLRGYEDHKWYPSPGLNFFFIFWVYIAATAILAIPATFILEVLADKYSNLRGNNILWSAFIVHTIIWIVIYIFVEINDYKEVKYFNSSGELRKKLQKEREEKEKRKITWDDITFFLSNAFKIALEFVVVGFTVWSIYKLITILL